MQMISTYNKYIMFLYSDMAFKKKKRIYLKYIIPKQTHLSMVLSHVQILCFGNVHINQILHLRTCSIYKPCILNKLLESGIIIIKKNY